MIIVICQHTGVEFEARSKAAKNHPEVSRILGELDRAAYGPMMDALAALRAEGRKPTLEEFAALAEAAKEAGRERRAVNLARFRAAREVRRARDRDFLYGRRQAVDEEDADFGSKAPLYSEADSDSRYDEV